MATQSPPEISLASPSHQALSGDDSINSIPVKCGSVCGVLYLDKIKVTGNKGSLKCIRANPLWYSPVEFESLGGKSKSKCWRRSIFHENVQLGIFLSSIGIHPNKASSPTPGFMALPHRTVGSPVNLLMPP